MNAMYIHEGNAIDYTPIVNVTAGDVIVQGELVGVAKLDIKANALGAIAVVGVFDFPKATGVSSGIAAGAEVYWDATAIQATTDSAVGVNKLIGRTIGAASDNDTTVRVRMSQ